MKRFPAIWSLLLVVTFHFSYAKGTVNVRHKHECNNMAGCVQIDDSHIIVTPSDCNGKDGSITGITATGTGVIKFIWYDADLVVVGSTADLIGVPPGKYKLSVTDQSKCTAAVKYYIVGQANPVVIDDSEVKIKSASCAANGSITNITIKNGNQYKWLDAYQNQVATTADLTNVVSGYYTLVASNIGGCSTSNTYFVPTTVSFPTLIKIDTIAGVCNRSPGSLNLTIQPTSDSVAFTCTIIDNLGYVMTDNHNTPLGGTITYNNGNPVIVNVPIDAPDAGYTVVLTNPNYCSTVIGRFSLPPAVLTILTNSPFFLVRNDACGRHTGGVFNLKLTGQSHAKPPPQIWTWTDSLGKVVEVARAPNLTDVGKGTYTVVVRDTAGCTASAQFTIKDSTAEAYPPKLTNSHIELCLPGMITIMVANPDGKKYKYRLYDSTQMQLAENSYGIFQVNVAQTSTYSITTIDGLCESDPTKMLVTVVAPGVIIPNTFTPNNDGANDYWIIPHVSDFPGAEVDVFSREGQLVFHSINYSHPFDGKYNGAPLPGGVYYYTIDLKQKACFGKISGSLTLLR